MTQQKIDDLFSQKSSKKRSRITTNDRDEFDDLFETTSSMKRIRTNNNNSNNIKQTTTTSDVFDFDIPSTSKTKRIHNDIDENKAIDDLFNNDTRKKLRRPIKTEQTPDVFDMFNIPSKSDDFKIPITQKKKIKTFFDNTDLTSIREENDTKEYIQVKPVLITSGQWLSKEAETKSTCKTSDDDIPDDERNLMHVQYASLVIDEDISKKKTKSNSLTRKSSKKLLDGKSFQKQVISTDSSILRKENLQSCFNALLEDINKPRIQQSSSSNRSIKSKISNNNEDGDDIDFFDTPTRKRKF